MAMLRMLRGTAWGFLRVALIAALDWFTTWLPKDNAGGVKGVWANAVEPGTTRESKRTESKNTVPPKKRSVPDFGGLKL
jgi:hypothetical protein